MVSRDFMGHYPMPAPEGCGVGLAFPSATNWSAERARNPLGRCRLLEFKRASNPVIVIDSNQ